MGWYYVRRCQRCCYTCVQHSRWEQESTATRENEAEVKAEIEERGWSKRTPDDDDGVLRRSNIHLVSCSNGKGMKSLLNSVMAMAADNGNRVYVMGAANVGKSSFINNMLEDV